MRKHQERLRVLPGTLLKTWPASLDRSLEEVGRNWEVALWSLIHEVEWRQAALPRSS